MAVDLVRAMSLAVDLDRIARVMPSRYDDRAGHDAAIADLGRAIAQADPRGVARENWQGAVIRAFGIRATCTSGLRGAVSNWIRQVEAKSALPFHNEGPLGGGQQGAGP